jgi:hypothetical protein
LVKYIPMTGVEEEPLDITLPVDSAPSSGFTDPRDHGPHNAYDYPAEYGTPVVAPGNMQFVAGGKGGSYLNDNDHWSWWKDTDTGREYRFAHHGDVSSFQPGDTVPRGEQWNIVGDAIKRPHIHMSVRENGQPIDFHNRIAGGGQSAIEIPGDPSNNISKRQNNPFNLNYAGQEGATPGAKNPNGGNFSAFETPEAGAAAGIRQIVKDQGRDMTLAQFGNKFFKGDGITDAQVDSYVKDISKLTGASPDTPIGSIPTAALARAVAKRESSTDIPESFIDKVLRGIGNLVGPSQAQAAEGPYTKMEGVGSSNAGSQYTPMGVGGDDDPPQRYPVTPSWRDESMGKDYADRMARIREEENKPRYNSDPTADAWLYAQDEAPGVDPIGKQATRLIVGLGRGALGTAESALSGLDWLFDSPLARDYQKKLAATREVVEPSPEEKTFLDQVYEGMGSSALFLIPGFGTEALVGKMAGGLLSIAGNTAKATKYVTTLARATGAGIASVLEALTEAGDSYKQALDEGKSKQDASRVATRVFGLNIPLLGLTNYFGFFGDNSRKFLVRALSTGASEGLQEMGQDVIQQTEGQPWDWNKLSKLNLKQVLEAGGVGAIVGVVGGGLTGGLRSPHTNTQADQRSSTQEAYTKPPGVNESVLTPDQMSGYPTIGDPGWVSLKPKVLTDTATVQGPQGPVQVAQMNTYAPPTETEGRGLYRYSQSMADMQSMTASANELASRYEASPAFTFGPSLEDIQSTVKGGTIEPLGGGDGFRITSPKGLDFAIHRVAEVAPDMVALQVGYGKGELGEGEKAVGAAMEADGKRWIEIAYSPLYDKYLITHELFHILEKSGMVTPKEQAALTKRVQADVRKGKWESLNKDDVGGAEDRAEYVAQAQKQREIDRKTLAGRVAQRGQDFVYSVLDHLGITTSGRVVQGVESGRFMENRTPVPAEAVYADQLRGQYRDTMRQYSVRDMDSDRKSNLSGRGRGAVRQSLKAGTKYVMENPIPGRILDYGAGEHPFQTTKYLSPAGFDSTPHDIHTNFSPERHNPYALNDRYETVMANNVLNAIPTEASVDKAIREIAYSTQPGGRAVVNFPADPRYNKLTADHIKGKLLDHFDHVERVGGTAKAPVFEAWMGSSGPKQPSVMLGVRTWEGHKAELLREAKAKGLPLADVKRFVQQADNIYRWQLDNPETIAPWHERFSAVKQNSDFYRWSLDFSTYCKKSDKLTATIGEIQKTLERGLTAEEFLQVRNMLEASGEIVPCHACYVFTRRMRAGKEMEKFRLAIEHINDPTPLEELAGSGKKGKKPTPKTARAWFEGMTGDLGVRFVRALEEQSLTERGIDINGMYSRDGLNRLGKEFPLMAETLATKLRSATHGKAMEDHVEYFGDLMKTLKPRDIKDFNSRAGLRWQSWSDFQVQHTLDAMQAIADMARLGLKGHAYTKVPEFAMLLGNTGLKINLSLIPKGTGLDANGNLVFDDVNGMPFEKAMELRDMFQANVGTVLIGCSDEHIRAALSDPRIDFVIPYHKSGMPGKWMESVGMGGWSDYTKDEGYEDLRDKTASNFLIKEWGKRIPNYEKHGFNPKLFQDLCAQEGVKPPFLDKFGKHPYYMKLITDFKYMHNHKPLSPQAPVQMVFDDAMLQKVMDSYEKGSITAANQPHMDTVNEFVNNAPTTPLSEWLPALAGTEDGINDLMNGKTTPQAMLAIRRMNSLAENKIIKPLGKGDQGQYLANNLDLPYWVAKHHVEFLPVYQVSQRRDEMRHRLNYDLHQQLAPTTEWWNQRTTQQQELFAKVAYKYDDMGTKGTLKGEPTDAMLQRDGFGPGAIHHYRQLRAALDYVWNEDIWNFRRDWLGEDPATMNDLDKQRRRKGTIDAFLPRPREGRYAIHGFRDFTDWSGKPGKASTHFELLDDALATATKGRMSARIADRLSQLQADYPGSNFETFQHQERLPDSSFWKADSANLQRIIDYASGNAVHGAENLQYLTEDERVQVASDLRKHILKETVDLLHSRGFGGHFKERANIPGFDATNPVKATLDFIQGYNGWKTKAVAAIEFHKALANFPINEKPQLHAYAKQYVQDMLANADKVDRLVDKSRGVMYAYFLGGVAKHIVIQPTQNFLTVAPILARHTKFSNTKIAVEMARTAKDMVDEKITGRPKDRALDINLQQGLQQAREKGLIEAPWTQEMEGNVKGTLGKAGDKLSQALGFFTSTGELFNRESTYRCAYNIASKEMGLNHLSAMKFAENVLREAHFEYGKKNLPQIVRGGGFNKVLRTGYVFKSFNANYTRFLTHNVMRERGGGWTAGRSLLALLVMGGAGSWPLWDQIEGLVQKWSGGVNIRAELKKHLGYWGHLLATGVPYAIGWDLGASLKFDLVGTAADPFSVVKTLSQNPLKALELLGQKDYYKAAEKLLPSGAANLSKAFRGAVFGLEDTHGKIIKDNGQAVRYTPWEAASKAMGFGVARETDYQQREQARKQTDRDWLDERESILDAMTKAKNRYGRDSEQYRDAALMKDRYNKELLDSPLPPAARKALRILPSTVVHRLLGRDSRKERAMKKFYLGVK